MTILVAAKDPNQPVMHILSDSRGTDNSYSYDMGTKWTEFKNFYIGIAGEAVAKTVIREVINKEINDFNIRTPGDVVRIHKQIELTIKESFDFKPTENSTRNYIDIEILIVTKSGKIFTCNQFLYVQEFDKFATLGSGSPFAESIVDWLYKKELVSEENLKEIMEFTYNKVYSCGGPTHLISLPIQPNE